MKYKQNMPLKAVLCFQLAYVVKLKSPQQQNNLLLQESDSGITAEIAVLLRLDSKKQCWTKKWPHTKWKVEHGPDRVFTPCFHQSMPEKTYCCWHDMRFENRQQRRRRKRKKKHCLFFFSFWRRQQKSSCRLPASTFYRVQPSLLWFKHEGQILYGAAHFFVLVQFTRAWAQCLPHLLRTVPGTVNRA